MRSTPPNNAGFTLIELLMAMAVFAVMSTMAYGGLASLLNTRQVIVQKADDLASLQITFNRLATDIEQALDRPSKIGTALASSSFSGGESLEFFLQFTHDGWSNPRKTRRSTLQRVAYSYDQETIHRSYWQTLDGSETEEPYTAPLLNGVTAVEIRFLAKDNTWHLYWPPSPEQAQIEPLPRAVEVVIEKKGWGRIRRLFEIVIPG